MIYHQMKHLDLINSSSSQFCLFCAHLSHFVRKMRVKTPPRTTISLLYMRIMRFQHKIWDKIDRQKHHLISLHPDPYFTHIVVRANFGHKNEHISHINLTTCPLICSFTSTPPPSMPTTPVIPSMQPSTHLCRLICDLDEKMKLIYLLLVHHLCDHQPKATLNHLPPHFSHLCEDELKSHLHAPIYAPPSCPYMCLYVDLH